MSKNENPILSLVVNILLPVVILNKGAHYLGPNGSFWALILALSFPLIYGLHDYIRNRHKNYVSILGVVNACLTGGLALFQLGGGWFALKDATLPFCLGTYVLISSFTDRPFTKIFFLNPQILKVDVLQSALQAKGTSQDFERLLKKGARFFSASFFLSGILNFLLALRIFTEIDPSLGQAERTQRLNEQIAHMTWMSLAIIALPLLAFTAAFLYWFFRRLTRLTGLAIDDLTID